MGSSAKAPAKRPPPSRCLGHFPGVYSLRATPVPIPNTEVKPQRASGTTVICRGRVGLCQGINQSGHPSGWPSLSLPPTMAIRIGVLFLSRSLFPSGDSMEAGYSSNLRFPIGEHAIVEHFDRAEVDSAIEEISVFPGRIRKRVEGLSEASLEKRYRPDGWTV